MHEDVGALEIAVARAVDQGARELDSLDRTIESLSEEFDRVVDSVAVHGSAADADILRESALEFSQSIRSHSIRQRKVLSTFNIAFFGRTGAGKSTLLSAFGRLNGGLVSPGESDWTTDVSEIEWAGCKLWDTPGINGWGRTRKRSELERVAREAVEVSDLGARGHRAGPHRRDLAEPDRPGHRDRPVERAQRRLQPDRQARRADRVRIPQSRQPAAPGTVGLHPPLPAEHTQPASMPLLTAKSRISGGRRQEWRAAAANPADYVYVLNSCSWLSR